jgi:hypothetical protein
MADDHFVKQALIEGLKALIENCRSNSCIEHASGIMEAEKIPERLSKGVSSISLNGDKKVLPYTSQLLFFVCSFLLPFVKVRRMKDQLILISMVSR